MMTQNTDNLNVILLMKYEI